MALIKIEGKTKFTGKTIFDAGYRFQDSNAEAYVAAVELADGSALETGVKEAYDAFIVGCKSDGIWSALKASCIMAGAKTLNGCLVPLVGTAPTNFNFVSADYNRKTGLIGDASTKYINTNRNQTADNKDNKHVAVYVTQNRTGDYIYFGGGVNTSGSTFATHYLGVRMLVTANGSGSLGFPTLSAPSLLGASRSNSTEFIGRFNGVSSTKAVASSPSNQNAIMHIFAGHNAGGKTNARMSFYSMGESLNLALLDTRVSALMTAINAAI